MFIIILFLAVISTAECANILGLMGMPSPSHHHWNSALMHELGRRGHNLTILSCDIPKKGQILPENIHYIHLENVYKSMYESDSGSEQLDISEFFGKSGIFHLHEFYEYIDFISPGILSSKGFQQLLNYPNDFPVDLIIYDSTAGPSLLGFLEKFKNVPLVGVTPFLNPPTTSDLTGSHMFPGYIPHWYTTYDVDMNFFERIDNSLINYWDYIYRRYILTPKLDKIFRPYYPKSTPYLGDLEKRAVLALVNSHPAVNYPESLPPNVIEVGGLQLTDPQPLPKDIDTFMNNSQKGAIFFSLGTNVNAANLKAERIQLILDVMSQLPQYNFLWKMDFDQSKFKVPKNLLIKPFFPQRDILGHPKIKIFVTHSGGLSTQEAIWRGVPMIGLALFGDQPRNLHKSVLNGIAAKVDYLTLTAKGLKDTILRVAEDKSFAENMKIRSQLYRDQKEKPLDRAVWWVEYVIRNPNATHLRSPAVNMNFFVAHSLDVLAFLLIVPIVLIIILWKLIGICFGKKSKTNNKFGKKKRE